MSTIRTIEPTQITTREEVHWTKSYADYPASLWQLNYYFRGPGVGMSLVWNTDVTADGDDFDIVASAAKTVLMTTAGVFTWQAWLTEIADTTNKILVGQGRTKVVLGFNPASDAAVETRTEAKIILDSINAAMLAFSTSDVLEYTISTPAGTRTVKRSDKTQLLAMRKEYAAIVSLENARERGRQGKSVIQTAQVVMYDK